MRRLVYVPVALPHRNEPQLVVSKEQATQWMGDTGFSLTRDARVFTDKYFLVFTALNAL